MTPTRRIFGTAVAACLLGFAVGCGGPRPATTPESAPLTLDDWKALPPAVKYQIETFERLKQGDPKLQDERAWQKFSRDVLVPAMKKDGVAVKRS